MASMMTQPHAPGPFVSRMLGWDRLLAIYRSARAENGWLGRRMLDKLDIRVHVSPGDLRHIPRSGATVVLANHPFGLLEAAALTSLLLDIRADVKVLANSELATIPELGGLVIGVDLNRAGTNAGASRRALAHLARGGLLLVFPAGEVAHFHLALAKVAESKWRPEVVKLIEAAARRGHKPALIPAHVPGRNSLLFHAAGLLHPRLRTLLLPRELLNKRGGEVEVRFGAPVLWEHFASRESAASKAQYLQWRAGLLANRRNAKAMTRRPMRRAARASAAIAAETPKPLLAADVNALSPDCLLESKGALQVFFAGPTEIPNVLREIGRLRELTFRAAGEGSGNALDLDEFDQHYRHLFLWNREKEEVAGAYRLAFTDEVLPARGLGGLYTASLFRYGPGFIASLGPAVELGRSFVRQEYQREFPPLLLLWRGIGKIVAANPQRRCLFGPVSVSNRYQPLSRSLILRFAETCARGCNWTGLVQGRRPPRAGEAPNLCRTIEELSDVISEVEPDRSGVPVLLRHYLRLGGQLLGFSVDREFSEVLDGFILVDLARTEPRLLERYLGKDSARRFLRVHGDAHGTFETLSDGKLAIAALGGGNPAADALL
jgi:putative hemolysin